MYGRPYRIGIQGTLEIHMTVRIADYGDYKQKGGQGTCDSGVLTVTLQSWDQFHDEVTRLLDLADFIWRGQMRDWPLIAKFDREVDSDRERRLKAHREAFTRAILGRRGVNPPRIDDPRAIWSLGQHYGLSTPLLDWTESPFVAAYFAFHEKPSGHNEPRCVYGLSEDIVRWGPTRSPEEAPSDHFIEMVRSLSDENPRLLSQRGLFTSPMSEDIEVQAIVQKCYANDPAKGRSRLILVKVLVPEAERRRCLTSLNRMNINHATLFPDLVGAASYRNMKLEIGEY
jgi:hypothetical protein